MPNFVATKERENEPATNPERISISFFSRLYYYSFSNSASLQRIPKNRTSVLAALYTAERKKTVKFLIAYQIQFMPKARWRTVTDLSAQIYSPNNSPKRND